MKKNARKTRKSREAAAAQKTTATPDAITPIPRPGTIPPSTPYNPDKPPKKQIA
jgi:hypothetical protein